jgi:hypothetical protein
VPRYVLTYLRMAPGAAVLVIALALVFGWGPAIGIVGTVVILGVINDIVTARSRRRGVRTGSAQHAQYGSFPDDFPDPRGDPRW